MVEMLLGAEVIVQQGTVDTGAIGDLLHPGAVAPLAGEDRQGGLEDPLLGFLRSGFCDGLRHY